MQLLAWYKDTLYFSPSTQVTSSYIDSDKIVTGTNVNGPGPIRTWDPQSGECFALLQSFISETKTPQQFESVRVSEEIDEWGEGWDGVTSLACQGCLLVTGTAYGFVCEQDFGDGHLISEHAVEQIGDKFWQLPFLVG